jgi:tetratricopeptide (TPR) repeat protein
MICIGLGWVAIKGMKSKNPLSFAILYFFITISLISNIFFLIESTMAERFLYTPSLGFAIAAALLLVKYFRLPLSSAIRKASDLFAAKPVFTMIVSVLLVLYAFKTISRNGDWKDNLTLLATDVKTCPNSARIRYAYGSALLIEKALKEENAAAKAGFLDRSIAELERGVAILPNYAEAWKNLGMAYKEKDNYPAAVAAFEKARTYKSFSDVDFFISSGLAYGMSKQYDKALADFNKALEIDPKNPEAYNNKGLYLSEMGRPDSALTFLDEAIRLKPEFYQAYYNKGNTLAQMKDFQGAISQYEAALVAKPGYVDAWLNMGNSYAAMQRFSEALPWFQKADSAQPNNFKAVVNLGITWQMLGDSAKSNFYFAQARKLEGAR